MLRINLKKLQKFDSSYFYCKSYFVGNDGTQNYLVFQPIKKYFKIYEVPRPTSGGFVPFTHISEWKSKGLSTESIKCLTTSNGNKILSPKPNYLGTKTRVE